VRFDRDDEREALLVDRDRRRGRDRRHPTERLALVHEVQAVVVDPGRVRPLLLQCVLYLEQVCEVGVCIDPDREFHRLLGVVQDRELLVEPVPDRAPADHGQLRVDVHGAGPGNQEEASLEVLQVVDGERVETLAVHREHPR
jgi:hypothetical protein